MSKIEENPVPDTPKKHSAITTGRLHKGKRIAVISVISAFTIGTVIALFALLPRGSDGLRIHFQPPTDDEEEVHFTMVDNRGRDRGTTFLRADPLGDAWPALAPDVRAHYDKVFAEKGDDLNGSNNYVDQNGQNCAMVYTFYLRNSSSKEEAGYRLSASINNYTAPTNEGARQPYDYLRILLIEGNVGEGDDYYAYFANANIQGMGTVDGGKEDLRECVSTCEKVDYDVETENPYSLRKALYSDGGVKYCVNFDNGLDKFCLFDLQERKIAPSKTRRITFIAYLEAMDPDCVGSAPQGVSLGLDLTVGV